MTTGKRVLIVDDDTTLLQMLGEQLQLHEEFSTVGAETGARALEEARSNYFDVIILDVGLPDSNKKLSGFIYKEKPPFQYLNWFFNQIYKWFRGLQGGYFDIVVGSVVKVNVCEEIEVE